MMPACTGLPPGELISSTTAREPESSKALRMAATTNSALASAPAAISPLTSTTAVCGEELVVVAVSLANSTHSTTRMSAVHSRRPNRRQRREARCSLMVAKTSFSSTSRSQPLDAAVRASAAAVAGVARAHRSAPGDGCDAEPGFSGGMGEVMSELDGFQVIGSMPVHQPRAFAQGDFHKRSEEHTSELQSQSNLVCRLLLEKKKKTHKD